VVVLGLRDAAENGGEKVVEIVGDAAGELSQRFEAVGPDDFLGAKGHLLRIAEDHHDAQGFALLIPCLARRPYDRGGHFSVGGHQCVFGVETRGFFKGEHEIDRRVVGFSVFLADQFEDVAKLKFGSVFK
jgi:hypothetical protein